MTSPAIREFFTAYVAAASRAEGIKNTDCEKFVKTV
jgi:hypothetical protein